jgi:hypothetical protein
MILSGRRESLEPPPSHGPRPRRQRSPASPQPCPA